MPRHSSSSLRPLGSALAVAFLCLTGVLVSPLAASAHDSLEATAPAAEESVASLDAVELSFSGTLLSIGEDQRSAAIQVTHDGRYFELDCPRLVDTTASVDVDLGEPGTYNVLWQVVSSDGHTISGDYDFEYAPADGTAAAEGTDAPACGDAPSDDAPNDDAILIGAAIGIGALALIGVVVALVLSRRRGRSLETEPDDETN